MHLKLTITFCIVITLTIVITALAFKMKEEENDIPINVVIIILGASLGWLLGIFMSPYDAGERASFAVYAGAVASFVSGYLVAKVDSSVTKLLSPEFLFQKIVAFRFISFFSVLLLAMLLTFAVRVYLPKPENAAIYNPNNACNADIFKHCLKSSNA
jgi:D-alanyl-lipoteichoic acid acyltransferase DltB (MBOAT superfamily)